MLVLSRRVEQKVWIGKDIVITIVTIGPNTVRIGIDAPKEIEILRAELIGKKPDNSDRETVNCERFWGRGIA
jgi:carbon storage regulator